MQLSFLQLLDYSFERISKKKFEIQNKSIKKKKKEEKKQPFDLSPKPVGPRSLSLCIMKPTLFIFHTQFQPGVTDNRESEKNPERKLSLFECILLLFFTTMD